MGRDQASSHARTHFDEYLALAADMLGELPAGGHRQPARRRRAARGRGTEPDLHHCVLAAAH